MGRFPGPVGDEIEVIFSACDAQLTAGGKPGAGSAVMRWGEGTVAIHTDFGPAGQDKDSNQDSVLAWIAGEGGEGGGIRWAIAMADGVTSSHYAETGAEIACWTSLAALLSAGGTADEKARAAVDAAGDAIGAVADMIGEEPSRYKPEDVFDSMWSYVLRRGLLLQTTLSLVWLEGGVCHIGMVGDAGAAIEVGPGEVGGRKVLAGPDLKTSRVHAIGPNNRRVERLDCWQQIDSEDVSLLALYTDGVGRGIGPNAGRLFHSFERMGSRAAHGNPAKRLIQDWIRTRGQDFEDNLSLAIVRWDHNR